MASSDKYVVLVTGGGGCLGQHLIGLLQTRAPHVTEIRVLDIKPYENRLDYKVSKPVLQFIGSVNDRRLVEKACRGVTSVFHLASIIDYSMFPDAEKMELVNVEGTCTLLDACKALGVKRFIYCSSMSVVLGLFNIIDGTESSTQYAKVPSPYHYASSKQKAETMVKETNSSALQTMSIRPVTLYGEGDTMVFSQALKLAKKFGGWQMFDCKGATGQTAYAGNVAWMFVCAEQTLRKGTDNNSAAGEVYNAADDTPCADSYEMLASFARGCNIPVKTNKKPIWLLLVFVYIVYFILYILSPFIKLNFPTAPPSVKQMCYAHNFKYDKARTLLGYAPLYSYEKAFERSVRFYKQYVHK